MGTAARAVLVGLLILSGSVWVGGLVTVVVVSMATGRTLDPAARVAFFRRFGRAFGMVSGAALVVALVTGGLLLHQRGWSAPVVATVVLAACLVLVTSVGVVQARRMTKLRQAIVADVARGGGGPALGARARLAVGLRALIALLTLSLVCLVAWLSA